MFFDLVLPIAYCLLQTFQNGADRFWQDVWGCMPACRLMGWEP